MSVLTHCFSSATFQVLLRVSVWINQPEERFGNRFVSFCLWSWVWQWGSRAAERCYIRSAFKVGLYTVKVRAGSYVIQSSQSSMVSYNWNKTGGINKTEQDTEAAAYG